MEMHQIRYFLAVCDKLNFTRAAKYCNVSQPSLTRAIKQLEQEFGGQMFHRERANTHLSELGRIVRPHLEEVNRLAQTAKSEAKDYVMLTRTCLRLGIMCTIAPNNLIAMLTRIQTRYPGIELKVTDSNAQSLHEELIKGEIEVAIYCLPDQPPNDNLNYIHLFLEQMYIVLPPKHRLTDREKITIKDLAGERYVLRSQCEFNEFVDRFFEAQGVDCQTVFESDRDDWVLAMIASGLGFGFAPEFSITSRDVVTRPLVDPEFWRKVSLVTVKGRPNSPAVGALIHEAMQTRWAGHEALAVVEERLRPGLGEEK